MNNDKNAEIKGFYQVDIYLKHNSNKKEVSYTMIFDKYLCEDTAETETIVDTLADDGKDIDPNSSEGITAIAQKVEDLMTASALEASTFFENGEEAVKNFVESAEVTALVEARKMSKKTFVRLSKNDDLQRRKNLSALMLAKEHKDSLWTKWSTARIRERQYRNQIYNKYENKATVVARKSQQQHIKNSRNLPALPKITM